MAKWLLLCWLTLVATNQLRAGDVVLVPQASKFVLQVDMAALRQGTLGPPLGELARKQVLEEVQNEQEFLPQYSKICEMLGFDPLREVQHLVVAAEDYEHPETSLIAQIDLGKSTGNLEGLLLSVPGYESTTFGDFTIHSAKPDGMNQVFATIASRSTGEKTVLVTTRRESLILLLEHFDHKPGPTETCRSLPRLGGSAGLIQLDIFSFPQEGLEPGPPANIAKILQSMALVIRESSDQVVVDATFATATEQKSEQLRQMFQGLIAMVDLAYSADSGDEDLARIKELTGTAQVDRSGTNVKLSVRANIDRLVQFIQQQVNDD